MKELKTLKDMPYMIEKTNTNEFKVILEQELRQEAIKRVKHCGCSLAGINKCSGCKRDIWFNNLTDEELKGD